MLKKTLVMVNLVVFVGFGSSAAYCDPPPRPSAVLYLREISQRAARLSVEAKKESPQDVRCDIGISSALNESQLCKAPKAIVNREGRSFKTGSMEEYAIIASALTVGEGPAKVVFPAQINKTEVGFTAELKKKRIKGQYQVILEIQPLFALPSAQGFALNEMGIQSARHLQESRTSQVAQNKNQMLRLQHLGANMGRFEKYQTYQQLVDENRNLEKLALQDTDALDRVSRYWDSVVKEQSIYVRLVSNGVTLPVDIKYVK